MINKTKKIRFRLKINIKMFNLKKKRKNNQKFQKYYNLKKLNHNHQNFQNEKRKNVEGKRINLLINLLECKCQ